MAVNYGKKQGSVYFESIDKPFQNPIIDTLVTASLAAHRLEYWGTKYSRTKILINGKYISIETQPILLTEYKLSAEIHHSSGVYWICGSQAYGTLFPKWNVSPWDTFFLTY